MRTQGIFLLILTTLIGGSVTAQTDLTGTHGTVVVNGDNTKPDAGVVLLPKSSRPSVAVQFEGFNGKFVVFNAANTELLRVRSDGNVGIGATEPRALLHLVRNNGNKDLNRGIGPELLLENNAATINDKSAITFASNKVARAQIRGGLAEGSAVGTLTFATGFDSLVDRMTIGVSGDTHIMGGSIPLKIQPDVGSGLPIAVEFQDLAYYQALPHGIRMNMPGNSEIRVSGLQIGKWSQPVISNVDGGDVFVQSRLNVRDVDRARGSLRHFRRLSGYPLLADAEADTAERRRRSETDRDVRILDRSRGQHAQAAAQDGRGNHPRSEPRAGGAPDDRAAGRKPPRATLVQRRDRRRRVPGPRGVGAVHH
ncbi:MAG TPA: hypothetical protein VEO54_03030 [Thermoanaerobaculia bacterium]|nr:hypothetical protein [Thermoanaerobaculia bacterium]